MSAHDLDDRGEPVAIPPIVDQPTWDAALAELRSPPIPPTLSFRCHRRRPTGFCQPPRVPYTFPARSEGLEPPTF